MLSDVSGIGDLMAVWKGYGSEEIFSHGQESEQMPADPSQSRWKYCLCFSRDRNIWFTAKGAELCSIGPNSSLQLLGALLGVQVRYKIQVPGMDCAPCSKTVVWMPAPPTLSYSLWVQGTRSPVTIEHRSQTGFQLNNHWIFHLVTFNLCSFTLEKRQSPGPSELFFWWKHRDPGSGGDAALEKGNKPHLHLGAFSGAQ